MRSRKKNERKENSNLFLPPFFYFSVGCVGWRRSHRPSLYDISIIDEQEEREDPEMQKDEVTLENTNSNANITVFTVTK